MGVAASIPGLGIPRRAHVPPCPRPPASAGAEAFQLTCPRAHSPAPTRPQAPGSVLPHQSGPGFATRLCSGQRDCSLGVPAGRHTDSSTQPSGSGKLASSSRPWALPRFRGWHLPEVFLCFSPKSQKARGRAGGRGQPPAPPARGSGAALPQVSRSEGWPGGGRL